MNQKVKKRNKFQSCIVEYIRRNRTDRKGKTQKRKEGVLFATSYNDKIAIGFSLTHRTLDKFDHIKGEKVPDFGVTVAQRRALRWMMTKRYSVISSEPNNIEDSLAVNIPPSIVPKLEKFIRRVEKYYKGQTIPDWAKNIQ